MNVRAVQDWLLRRQPLLGAVLLGLLALPSARHALEAGMAPHMLLQYPGLMLAGALLVAGVPRAWRPALQRWNALGIGGLVACALILSIGMIPRLLDLALVDGRVELAKFAALALAGAALRASWRPAGLVVQAFFLGNLLPMMVIVGALYQDAPQRLCNAYRFDEQQSLGLALAWIAAAIGAAWLVRAGWWLARSGDAVQAVAEE